MPGGRGHKSKNTAPAGSVYQALLNHLLYYHRFSCPDCKQHGLSKLAALGEAFQYFGTDLVILIKYASPRYYDMPDMFS